MALGLGVAFDAIETVAGTRIADRSATKRTIINS
jgi:hypothetical protein